MSKETKHFAKSPKIIKCSCAHEYQDEIYGKGFRLMNPTAKGYRCTVCSNVK